MKQYKLLIAYSFMFLALCESVYAMQCKNPRYEIIPNYSGTGPTITSDEPTIFRRPRNHPTFYKPSNNLRFIMMGNENSHDFEYWEDYKEHRGQNPLASPINIKNCLESIDTFVKSNKENKARLAKFKIECERFKE